MRRTALSLILLVLSLTFGVLVSYTTPARAVDIPPGDTRTEIERAFYSSVERNYSRVLAYVVYDTGIERITVSEDGLWGLIWINSIDRDTGRVIASEPGLGIARLVAGEWSVSLQSDSTWLADFQLIPADLMPDADREMWTNFFRGSCNTSNLGPFTGYKLPWEGGISRVLTRSILHHFPPDPTGSMHYAFDFAAPWVNGSSPMFDVFAAKSATVKFVREHQPNGDEGSPGNYIVLEDTATNPATYQLYLHLAENSIPSEFETPGAQVYQGEKIGLADDTGASSGNHLHLQVHTNSTSYWGCSVDIRFDDVDENQGRPRTPVEADSYPEFGSESAPGSKYTSENYGGPPPDTGKPTGGLYEPDLGDVFGSSVTLDGWVQDPAGIAEARFVVEYAGNWVAVGPTFQNTGNLAYTWDMCSDGVPDGPVKVAINAEDNDGNTGLHLGALAFIKDASCTPPPPACSPSAAQIALFEFPDYQGSCQVYGPGDHLLSYSRVALEPELAGEQVGSIKVGRDLIATLYYDPTFQGRAESFAEDDVSLLDNWIGGGTVHWVSVRAKTEIPFGPNPYWPESDSSYPAFSTLTLVWDDGGGAEEFQGELTTPTRGTVSSAWSSDSSWMLGSLDPGTYSWKVRARNSAGTTGWSPDQIFTIDSPARTALRAPDALPLDEDFESGANGWVGTGLWNLLDDSVALSGDHSWWYGGPAGNYSGGDYDTGLPNTGDLTSPVFQVPAQGYYLRYWSRYETEGYERQWDRRWVQISVNGGPFTNLYQLSDDPASFWVKSPYFDLSAYSGQQVQIRFHFETLDERNNGFKGWLIDDVSIDTGSPPACTAVGEPDNNRQDARVISYGGVYAGEICPSGDVDYFEFFGTAGDHIGLDIDAKEDGSLLDGYLFLYGEDGTSLIAENDDEILFVILDSLLDYTLPRTGTYIAKLRAWNHPGVGTDALFYTLRLNKDSQDPVFTDLRLAGNYEFPSDVPDVVGLIADVTDSGSGVSRVEFYYHSNDWGNGEWIELGIDTDGSDGWRVNWDTTVHPAGWGITLIAVASDRAGNIETFGNWRVFQLPAQGFLPLISR